MRRNAVGLLAVAAALLTPASAQAAEGQAYAAGLVYATPAVVIAQGDSLRFNNLDPLAGHDLDSDTPGLFSSPVVGNGASTPVTGVEVLEPGTYPFHCSLHSWMNGTLQVGDIPSVGGVPPIEPPDDDAVPNPADLWPKAPQGFDADKGHWPLYGRDLANSRNGGAGGPSWNEIPTLGVAWTFKSTDGDFTGTPVESAGTVVAAAGGGTVFALDARTGAKKWSHDFNQPINGTAAIEGGSVFVPLAEPGSPKVAALSLATGAVLWTTTVDTQPDADVYGSPVAWNGKVFIGVSALFGELGNPGVSVRGSVVALDAATGAQAWKTYLVPAGLDGAAVWTTPAIDTATGMLYVGTGNAYHAPAADTTDSIIKIDAANGTLVDHFQATAGDVWNATENFGAGPDFDFGASPQLIKGADGKALVGEGQKSGIYWAVDRATLDVEWSFQTGPGSFVGGIIGSTAYDGQRIYGADTPGGEMWALTRAGLPAWVSSDGGPLHFASTAVANGVVYSNDMSGFLTAREALTGTVLARLPLGAPSWGGVSVAGGSVFAVTGSQTASGYVVAYRPRG